MDYKEQANPTETADIPLLPDARSEKEPDLPVVLARKDPYRALRSPNFRLFFLASFLTSIGEQMASVAIGWALYQRTNSPLALGLVGLVQVLPVIALSLPAGQIADRANRKRIMLIDQAAFALAALGLTILSLIQGPLVLIYGCLLIGGIASAFNGPVVSAMLAQTVTRDAFESAATWESSSWQLASVGGPALAGLMIGLFNSATPVFLINTLALTVVFFCILALRIDQPVVKVLERANLRSLLEGLSFLRQTQVLLAAITLDLFAVLLGGAVTLLPIYARDILHVGPTGLGWLLAMPSVGALCVTFSLAYLPSFKHAGRTLLLAVGVFGLATCVFGLSRLFWLSLGILFVLGAMDNISVVVRSTLLLTRTPEGMRGRVAAVNTLFIAMSNQLGGFESGVAAQLLGPVTAVTAGGVGTIIVVILVAVCWPEMRHLKTLSEVNE